MDGCTSEELSPPKKSSRKNTSISSCTKKETTFETDSNIKNCSTHSKLSSNITIFDEI